MTRYEPWVGLNQSKLAWDVMTGYEPWVSPNQSKLAWDVMTGYEPWVGPEPVKIGIIIIIIITYIYNALNDALSASRIHSKLKTILSKYVHIQNRQS